MMTSIVVGTIVLAGCLVGFGLWQSTRSSRSVTQILAELEAPSAKR